MDPAPRPERPALRVDELQRACAGWRVQVVAASGSTNLDLGALARSGAPERSVLVAEHQTAGRGRIERPFQTPDRAALTVSVLLRPAPGLPMDLWPWLPLLAGLAVRAAVARLHPAVEVALKWPNDVLLAPTGSDQGGKICGILAERIETPGGAALVLGMGLNVSTTRAELPVPTAASLATAGVPVAELDRTALLIVLLEELAALLVPWEAGDARALREQYVRACSTLHQEVRVELPQGSVLTGRAVDVDADGRLVVQAGAERVVVSAGDVVHVRRVNDQPGK